MNRTMMGGLAVVLLAAGLLLGALAISRGRPEFESGVARPPQTEPMPQPAGRNSEASSTTSGEGWLKEFALTERSGKRIRTQDLAGKVHVVNFFFAKCPTVCRTQTTAFRGVAQ